MKHRAIILFPVATAIITLALLAMAVINGWFGEPTGVGSCFCEAERPGLVKQPVNTFSNFGFILTGIYIGWVLACGKYAENKNSLTQNPFYAAFFSSLVVYLGPGSMAMHATTTAMGGFLDMLSMYLVAAFLVAYAAERLFKLKPVQFIGIFLAIIGICLWANAQTFHFIFDFFGNTVFATLVGLTVVFEAMNLFVRKMRHESRWAFLSFGAMVLAFGIWHLSKTDAPFCDPHSLIQGHAIWHLLNAVSLYFLFRYYVSEQVE
ncbi:MAG: ceramidase domain-containing protein [Verrucomicrobiota bacterium]